MNSVTDLLYKVSKTDEDVSILLAQHKNLIYYMLTNMHQLSNNDAESAAWEALWDAIGTFDAFATTTFGTYACHLIRNAINGVVRKQLLEAGKQCNYMHLSERNNLVCFVETDNIGLTDFITKQFKIFIESRTGLARNVLLVWYGTSFSASVTGIAKACGCSPSYVTRVQTTFRAFLSGKLKDF